MAELKIYGVGVDLIEVKRIKSAIEKNPGFIKKVYTDSEVKYCAGKLRSCFINYAERFAAKEAVVKALGTGIGEVSWLDIEILRGERGEPMLHLYGNAQRIADQLGLMDWSVSLSHTQNIAVAVVVAVD